MKKTLGTIAAAAAVVLLTATFCFAEYAAAGVEFPLFPTGMLDCRWVDPCQPEKKI